MRLKISRLSVLPVISVLTITLAGCGGSSNSSQVANGGTRTQITSTPTTPTNPAPNSTTLRTYTAGDSWTYKVTGTLVTTSGTSTVSNGQFVQFVQTYGGPESSMSFNYSYSLPWSSAQTEVRNYIEMIFQTSAGSNPGVYKVADTLTDTPFGMAGSIELADGTNLDPTNGIYASQWFLPQIWGLNKGMSSQDTYVNFTADGKLNIANNQKFAITVDKEEAVSVPLGSFTCWKTNQLASYQSNAMRTIKSTCWWSPSLGAPVMMDTVEENTTGTGTSATSNGTRTLHYELVSTTVPNAGLSTAFLAKVAKK